MGVVDRTWHRFFGRTFRGEAPADPDAELRREGGAALAQAIANAANDAAKDLARRGMTEADSVEFKISAIRVTVKPNPGPTAYSVTLKE